MYITYFFLIHLKFITSSNDVVEKVPNFSLKEIFFESKSVIDFCLEHKFIVIVAQLNKNRSTLTIPLEPHIPTD